MSLDDVDYEIALLRRSIKAGYNACLEAENDGHLDLSNTILTQVQDLQSDLSDALKFRETLVNPKSTEPVDQQFPDELDSLVSKLKAQEILIKDLQFKVKLFETELEEYREKLE
jgi:hypothetical protein